MKKRAARNLGFTCCEKLNPAGSLYSTGSFHPCRYLAISSRATSIFGARNLFRFDARRPLGRKSFRLLFPFEPRSGLQSLIRLDCGYAALGEMRQW